MSSTNTSNVPVVLVTGFGPFRTILVNPSWEIAKALNMYVEWPHPIHLIIEQMQVTYEDVSKRIPELWLKYNPTLVIHIGVASGSKAIQLERHACNFNYCHIDNNGTKPENGCCVQSTSSQDISTGLPIDEACHRVKRRTEIPICVSNDAGRYLCEFIYYQSLFIDRKRVVFIHVPDFNDNFTLEAMTNTIQMIISELLGLVDPLPVLNQNGNYLINPKGISSSD